MKNKFLQSGLFVLAVVVLNTPNADGSPQAFSVPDDDASLVPITTGQPAADPAVAPTGAPLTNNATIAANLATALAQVTEDATTIATLQTAVTQAITDLGGTPPAGASTSSN